MSEKEKYFLIDGNNLAVRAAFANSELTSLEGEPSGVHYGFINSLVFSKQRFPNYKQVIAWDSKSKFRMNLTEIACKEGMIPELYKANRKKDELPKPLADFYDQSDYLKRGVDKLGIPQVKIDGCEADDVIATYSKYLSSNNHEVVILTSDEDYYQLVDENVSIWNSQKDIFIDKKYLMDTYGISGEDFIHLGALMGDNGDNIFGIPGCGPAKALKIIHEHKTIKAYYDHLKNKYADKIEQFKDIIITDEQFKELKEAICNPLAKNKKAKYPYIYRNMPNLNLIWADYTDELKINKIDLMSLCFEDVVGLAYNLKAMILDVPVPEISDIKLDKKRFLEYCDYYDMETLKYNVEEFFKR